MNLTLSLIRASLLIFLFCFGMLYVFSGDVDTSAPAWVIRLLLIKVLGLAALCLMVLLYSRWQHTDPLIRRFDADN